MLLSNSYDNVVALVEKKSESTSVLTTSEEHLSSSYAIQEIPFPRDFTVSLWLDQANVAHRQPYSKWRKKPKQKGPKLNISQLSPIKGLPEKVCLNVAKISTKNC